ncbi:MAG: hypothetical protein COA44_08605 [Arcobacter sp.]|nr:MAG: hypothetical protein COA44_08605 [Arcobacter sp.]
MNKFLALGLLITVLLFSGCSRTTAFDFFSTDTYYEKAVSNMQKVSLMKDMETKALLHAIYLNNVDEELYNDGEYFFIAIHIIDESRDGNRSGLNNPLYSLKMIESIEIEVPDIQSYKAKDINTTKPKLISHLPLIVKPLDQDNVLRLSMPIKNRWNQYYLLKFEKIKEEKIRLVFESDLYGSAPLTFLKEE